MKIDQICVKFSEFWKKKDYWFALEAESGNYCVLTLWQKLHWGQTSSVLRHIALSSRSSFTLWHTSSLHTVVLIFLGQIPSYHQGMSQLCSLLDHGMRDGAELLADYNHQMAWSDPFLWWPFCTREGLCLDLRTLGGPWN